MFDRAGCLLFAAVRPKVGNRSFKIIKFGYAVLDVSMCIAAGSFAQKVVNALNESLSNEVARLEEEQDSEFGDAYEA